MSIANYDGRTALHLAASEGHSSCVKFLVEVCHLSPLAKDRYANKLIYIHSTFIQNCYFNRWGFCPLVEAERFQHDFVFRYLAKHVEDNFPEALEELLKKEDKK